MLTFNELKLSAPLQQALARLKFVNPTAIQVAALPLALEGQDLMACSKTGSGKTAAFALPMIQRLLDQPDTQGLVLAPTRELAQQIADVMRDLTRYCERLHVNTIAGGADIRKQIKALKRRPRIIVATPGRLIDHLNRKTIRLNNVGLLVLDEGDRMLDMGFAPQLDTILTYLPKQRQNMLFTATLPKSVQGLAQKYLHKPRLVKVGSLSQPVETVKQSVVQVRSEHKKNRLLDELNARDGSVIVFARTKLRTDRLADQLKDYGYSVDRIHGDCSQGQRNRAIRNIKTGRARILCATDVAARGIDIPEVAHVINFDIPKFGEDYVHRIGRTARNGAIGEAISFVEPSESRLWNSISKQFNIKGGLLKDNQSKALRKPTARKTRRRLKKRRQA